MKRFLFILLAFAACEPVACGGGRGVVLSPRDQCRERPPVTPLFVEGPADTSPAVVTRADGVIVTTITGRVRGRHDVKNASLRTIRVRSRIAVTPSPSKTQSLQGVQRSP